MHSVRWHVAAAAVLALGWTARADVKVVTRIQAIGADFVFDGVPLPSDNDAATAAQFSLVDGAGDSNGGGLDALHDGQVPSSEDQPSKNFFFQPGADGGRLLIDLGRTIAVKRICSYSWHGGSRAPQVYAVYASDGKTAGFELKPKRGTEPAACGWRRVARVDTRSASGEDEGGQCGVRIEDEQGTLGSCRYLLFDVSRTESRDPFGNTFFSEIDVVEAGGPAPTSALVPKKAVRKNFSAENGNYRFTLDATEAPDLAEWGEKVLAPVVQVWYPKLVAALPSDGYRAPTEVVLRFRENMGGTPAAAGGRCIDLNSAWFRQQLRGEALGAVVHEMVHVVQNYGRAHRTNPKPADTPGWVVEGIADYVRWFLYEPQTHGAEITKGNLASSRYDASYRVTANFLNWATQTYDRELVRKLNAMAREGRYDASFWKAETGKSVQELGDAWKAFNARRLNGAP